MLIWNWYIRVDKISDYDYDYKEGEEASENDKTFKQRPEPKQRPISQVANHETIEMENFRTNIIGKKNGCYMNFDDQG